jgi:hypothetical protein
MNISNQRYELTMLNIDLDLSLFMLGLIQSSVTWYPTWRGRRHADLGDRHCHMAWNAQHNGTRSVALINTLKLLVNTLNN